MDKCYENGPVEDDSCYAATHGSSTLKVRSHRTRCGVPNGTARHRNASSVNKPLGVQAQSPTVSIAERLIVESDR